jgi:hypothetical protein
MFIDERKVSPELTRQEKEADDFAGDWLVGAGRVQHKGLLRHRAKNKPTKFENNSGHCL